MKSNGALVLREYGEINLGEGTSSCHACHSKSDSNKDNAITLCPKHYEGLANSIRAHEKNRFDDDSERKIVDFQHKRMKVRNYVGALEAETEAGPLAIEILPKIDLGAPATADNDQTQIRRTRNIFLKMLQPYLSRKTPVAFENVHIQQHADMPLMEIFILMFLKEVQKLLQKGLAHAYVPQEGNLYCLRGKLDFAGQLRYNLAHAERFYVHYDEWTPDRPVNRVIKCALDLVRRATRHPTNYRLMAQLLPHFDAVTLAQDWRVEDRQVQLQRNIKDYYELPLNWARIILDHLNPASWRAEKLAYSLLFPMEEVFESYVTERLRHFMNELDYHLQPQDAKYYLMAQEGKGISFRMQPDMVAWPKSKRANQPLLILDTKWKGVNEDNQQDKYDINQSDLYQLYSYGMRYWRGDDNAERLLPILFLLYPRHGGFTDPIILLEGKSGTAQKGRLNLHCLPVDLSDVDKEKGRPLGETEELLRQLLSRKRFKE